MLFETRVQQLKWLKEGRSTYLKLWLTLLTQTNNVFFLDFVMLMSLFEKKKSYSAFIEKESSGMSVTYYRLKLFGYLHYYY